MAKKKAKKTSGKKKSTGKKSSPLNRLKKMQSGWEDAAPRRGGAPVPDGNYTGRIESAILEEAKESQRLQIHWIIVIADEQYEGKKVHKFDGINEAKDLEWVQGTLEAIELDIPDDIADIGETLEEAAGLLIDITVATKDEFLNVYFNELAEDGEDEEEEEEGEEEEEEEEEAEEAEEEEEEEEEEGEGYDEDDINEMKKKDLIELIDDEELDVDPTEHKGVKALRAAVIEEMF
jgi:hypothetical protein